MRPDHLSSVIFHLAFVIVGKVNDFLKGRRFVSENGKRWIQDEVQL